MNRYISGAILLMLSCFLYSCSFRKLVAGKKPQVYVWHIVNTDSNGVAKSKPRIMLPQPDTVLNTTDSAIYVKQLIDQVTPLWTTRLQYRTFSGKAKMRMEAPDDKQDFTAHIRVRKDSVIWINITALGGLPAARILITPDSFFLVNTLQKTAICVPLTKAAKILPAKVDFSSLLNLILGEPLRDGVITEATSIGDKWVIRVEDTGYIQAITYSKTDSTMITGQLLTHKPGGPRAITQYSHYEITDHRRLSTDRVLSLQNGNDVYTLEMNFTKFGFDEELDYPFSIPKSYEINPVAQ